MCWERSDFQQIMLGILIFCFLRFHLKSVYMQLLHTIYTSFLRNSWKQIVSSGVYRFPCLRSHEHEPLYTLRNIKKSYGHHGTAASLRDLPNIYLKTLRGETSTKKKNMKTLRNPSILNMIWWRIKTLFPFIT